MKKKVPTICIILALSLLLSGCGSVYSNYREVEQLLVIETMGIDYRPGGVELSLAAGMKSTQGKGPVRLTGSGESISAAMDQARNYSFEDELFCSQTNSILIGEEAARQGIEPYLSYICQSPILRTDLPVFIVKGGSARDAILNTGDGHHGVAEILQGVTEYLQYRGSSHVFKAADIVRSSLRHGSALCCVLEYTDSAEPPVEGSQDKSASGQSETPSGGGDSGGSSDNGGTGSSSGSSSDTQAKTLAVAGFGVLQGNRLVSYIDDEQAVGVGFLINEVGISVIELNDAGGRPVVLEINDGRSRLIPRWDEDGALSGLDFDIEVSATATEINDDADLSDAEYIDALTGALEDYVATLCAGVLRLSSRLGADFLGLGSQVDMAEPLFWRMQGKSLEQLLPGLEMRVSVRGQLSHSNDMKESLT